MTSSFLRLRVLNLEVVGPAVEGEVDELFEEIVNAVLFDDDEIVGAIVVVGAVAGGASDPFLLYSVPLSPPSSSCSCTYSCASTLLDSPSGDEAVDVVAPVAPLVVLPAPPLRRRWRVGLLRDVGDAGAGAVADVVAEPVLVFPEASALLAIANVRGICRSSRLSGLAPRTPSPPPAPRRRRLR